jgi:hypothetical protein
MTPTLHAGLDQSSETGIFVRIPVGSTSDLVALHLSPVRMVDYDSYLWIEIDAEDYERLWKSDVSFTVAANAGTVQITGYSFDPTVQGSNQL